MQVTQVGIIKEPLQITRSAKNFNTFFRHRVFFFFLTKFRQRKFFNSETIILQKTLSAISRSQELADLPSR